MSWKKPERRCPHLQGLVATIDESLPRSGADRRGVLGLDTTRGDRLFISWLGTGFKDPWKSEIHLVIHDHGPLIDGREAEMTGSYRGGCTDASLPEIVPATAKADGSAGPNTCKLVQDVIFMQPN